MPEALISRETCPKPCERKKLAATQPINDLKFRELRLGVVEKACDEIGVAGFFYLLEILAEKFTGHVTLRV